MISYSMQTDIGTQYDGNEDTVGHDTATAVWLVADGMGGHAAGEVASQIAKDTFIECIRAGEGHEQAVLLAHQAIAQSAAAQAAQQGMGSTLVALQIESAHARLVWVGDSRAYLWRDDSLSVVSHDHSYVQMLIDEGHLSEEAARDHPKRNMVTQVLGLGDPKPESRAVPLQTGDWLILCSDGLNDELTDDEIAETIRATKGDVAQAAPLLIKEALAHNARDNVSVVAVAYEGASAVIDHPPSESTESTFDFRELTRSPLVWGGFAAILVFVIFVMLMKGG